MQRNNVRGPTSALTDFLRSQGITASTVTRRAATQNQPQSNAQNDVTQATTTQADQSVDPAGASASLTPRRRTRRTVSVEGYVSDELDEPVSPPKKQKISKDAAKAKGRSKAKKNEDEDEDDAYTALSSMWSTKSGAPKPPAGSIIECVKCQKKFTATKYTMAANPGPGFLCHACTKAGGIDPFKKVATRKRKPAAERRNVVHYEERRFPSLASLCIEVLSHNINDVESLGDIGTMNMEAISKAISKNRSLTAENVHLFYGAEYEYLTLYDVTKLKPEAFITLGQLNPNLTSLRLDFCGLISDDVLLAWCNGLQRLTSLELLGPFLVRPPAWISFFRSHCKLERFMLTQSPRFDLACIEALIDSCANLHSLRLREVGKMSDEMLNRIQKLGDRLKYLDIAEPAASCSEEAIIELLSAVGKNLTHFNVSSHLELTDTVLESGIKPYVSSLESLVLSDLPLLTDAGVFKFFSDWRENPPLTYLSLSRNPDLSTEALDAILSHSGDGLKELNINGWKDVEGESLASIGKRARELKKLDLGWCRQLDDFVVRDILEHNKGLLSDLHIWGCNRVEGRWRMDGTRMKRLVRVHGIESRKVY